MQVEALDISEIIWLDCIERRIRRLEKKTPRNQYLIGEWGKRKLRNIEKEQQEI